MQNVANVLRTSQIWLLHEVRLDIFKMTKLEHRGKTGDLIMMTTQGRCEKVEMEGYFTRDNGRIQSHE